MCVPLTQGGDTCYIHTQRVIILTHVTKITTTILLTTCHQILSVVEDGVEVRHPALVFINQVVYAIIARVACKVSKTLADHHAPHKPLHHLSSGMCREWGGMVNGEGELVRLHCLPLARNRSKSTHPLKMQQIYNDPSKHYIFQISQEGFFIKRDNKSRHTHDTHFQISTREI